MNNKQFNLYPWPKGKTPDVIYPGKKTKRKIGIFTPINVKSVSAQLVNSIKVYQAFCWHCDFMWRRPFIPKIVREGLKCSVCDKLC